MIHSLRFTCVLDTNVIYPLNTRDLLLWFAYYKLYTPKWSQHIWDEWKEVLARKGLDDATIESRTMRPADAFPDAMVINYDSLIDGLELPDTKDRHVLAAAIKANANLIITNNLKDFPRDYLSQFGLRAKSADDFLADTIDLNQQTAVEAFRRLVLNRRSPAMDEYDVLKALRNNGLDNTAAYLHALI